MLDMLPPPASVGPFSSRSASAERELALRLAQVGNSEVTTSRACSSPVITQFSPFPSRCGKCPNCLEYKRWIADVRVQLEVQAADTVFWGRISYKRDPDSLVEGSKTFGDVEREFYSARISASLDRLRKSCPGVRFGYVVQAERGSLGGRLHHHVLLVADRPVRQNAVKQAFSGKRKDRARKPDRFLSSKALATRRARDKARAYLSSAHQVRRARVSGQQYWQTVKSAGVVNPARGSALKLARYLSKYLSKDASLPVRRSAGFGSRVVAQSFAPGELAACIADMRVDGDRWFEHRIGDVRVPWALLKPLVRRFDGELRDQAAADGFALWCHRMGLTVEQWQRGRAANLEDVSRAEANRRPVWVLPVPQASFFDPRFGWEVGVCA